MIVKWAYLLALAAWIGGMMFFSLVVAPTTFKTLAEEDAARLIRRIFPKYYLLGIVCAAAGIACVGVLLAEQSVGVLPGVLSLLLLAGAVGSNLWLRQAVLPAMNKLREGPAGARDGQWKSLHRLTVRLNALVLFCGLVLLWLFVFARAV